VIFSETEQRIAKDACIYRRYCSTIYFSSYITASEFRDLALSFSVPFVL
jgi:hypothetical protein